MSKEAGIKQVFGGGGHIVILGAGASIAATRRNNELSGKQLPSMDNFIDVVGLRDIVDQLPAHLVAQNFEDLYSKLHSHNPRSPEILEIERRVQDYFNDMNLPNEPTIYDYLVLSLRPRDVIATFNWDPLLYQAWTRNSHVGDLPGILFLHGNVAIGYDHEDQSGGPAGMISKITMNEFVPTRLLYPIHQKNYTDDEFISGQWEAIREELNDKSNVRVTIFGYGAPASDVEAVQLLNQAWGAPDDRAMEQFEIIDIVPEEQLRDRWSGFIHSHHYDISDSYFTSSLAMNPRRTSESYFSHYKPLTIDEAFRNNNPVPQTFKTLEELWEWHKPLIQAEEEAKLNNNQNNL